MAVETVLLALLGLVALWLVVDAGRERHRLKARMARAERRDLERRRAARAARARRAATGTGAGPWPYWPLTLPAADDGSVGPRL